jgi:hypothetical protein
MIDPDLMFTASKYFALASWLLLFVSLFAPSTRRMIWPFTQFIAPAILCFCYVLMVWDGWHHLDLPHSFVDLLGIRDLYTNLGPLTASWLHFLALDLFVGSWIVRDGLERGLPKLVIFLVLPFVFIFGPSGLLLYILLRYTIRGNGTPHTG